MFTYKPPSLRSPFRVRVSALTIATSIGMSLSISSASHGFDEFKEVLQQRYRLKSVSCKACHTGNKDKKIRNAFGKLLDKELKDNNLTKRYNAAQEEDDDAKQQFEKTMLQEFSIALDAVEKKPITFLALMEAGLLNGTRLDKNQVDPDSLTIKTLSDSELEAIKAENSSLIEGQIQQMPPETDSASDQKPTMTPEGSNPASKSETVDASLVSDDKTTNNPTSPAAQDETEKLE